MIDVIIYCIIIVLAIPMSISLTYSESHSVQVKHIPGIILFSVFPGINCIFALMTIIGIFMFIGCEISKLFKNSFPKIVEFWNKELIK